MQFRATWAVGVVAAALTAAACGDDSTSATGGGAGATSVDEVVYEGGTNDEALGELRSLPAVEDAAQRATFVTPADGATLPQDPIARFAWSLPGQASRATPLDLMPTRAPSAPERVLTSALQDLLAWVPEAHAHGEPVNGQTYALTFSDASGAVVLEVFTSLEEYTPSVEAWAKLAEASDPVRVSLVSAFFESNRVTQDGGPYVGGDVSITIE